METDYAGGFRILRGAVNVGDYIRIDGHRVNGGDVWWKVVSIDDTSRDPVVELVNAAGSTRTRTLLQGDRVYRHAYSQKHSVPTLKEN